MSRKLAELLVKEKLIQPTQFTEAESAAHAGKAHIKFLIEKNYINETDLLKFLGKKFNMPSINISKFEVKPELAKLVPGELVKKVQAIPIQANKGTIVVAIWDPTLSLGSLDEIKAVSKMNVEAVLTLMSAFDAAYARTYMGVGSANDAFAAFKKKEADEKKANPNVADMSVEIVEMHDIDNGNNASDAPVIAIVNSILSECIKRAASDIHVEPYEHRMRVRMRCDGTMLEVLEVPLDMKRAVTARFKIMARMDISESRVPQDGRIKLKAAGKDVDFRVNCMPTLFGEKICLRMLSKGNLNLDLKTMGFSDKQLAIFKRGINAPNGLCLVTGPTGSGKTTTLYSALSELNTVHDNLSTAEDPVEYNLEGINQCQVQKEVGLTFASVLRALLRQDPDTILVGEIRDFETAETAVQAALTGHLVLSTLHTNDAVATITRLMNMGLEPFLVCASVNVILAQRLLRRNCPKCKTEDTQTPKQALIDLGISATAAEKIKLFRSPGCKECNNTGFKGRCAIYEVLDFSEELKKMVLAGSSVIDLKKQALKEGLQTLRMSAITKAVEGTTSLEEAIGATVDH